LQLNLGRPVAFGSIGQRPPVYLSGAGLIALPITQMTTQDDDFRGGVALLDIEALKPIFLASAQTPYLDIVDVDVTQ
jgi:hypothetical protein